MMTGKKLFTHLYVTPICNLHCKHCYYEAMSMDNEIKGLLAIGDFEYILKTLNTKFDAFFDVEGGEIFVRPNILNLFVDLPKSVLQKITITTNGTLPIPIPYKHLRNLNEFRISVEGHTDELQKDLRGISLTPVLDNALSLLRNNVTPTLRITLHKKNFFMIEEMISFFTNLGFSKFSFYEFQSAGRGRECDEEYLLTSSEFLSLINNISLINHARCQVLKFSFSSKRTEVITQHRSKIRENNFRIDFLTSYHSLTINFNGELGVCPWKVDDSVIGTYNKNSFSKDIVDFYNSGKLMHQCQQCTAVRVIKNSNV